MAGHSTALTNKPQGHMRDLEHKKSAYLFLKMIRKKVTAGQSRRQYIIFKYFILYIHRLLLYYI